MVMPFHQGSGISIKIAPNEAVRSKRCPFAIADPIASLWCYAQQVLFN